MDVFISWSGDLSKSIAELLRNWLPKVIQNLKPWISVSDIEKGSRWLKDISGKLEETEFGILCLTPDNLQEPWILFEAGALSKALESSFVCPILYQLEPTAVTGPLAQFQATRLGKDDMLKLLRTINGRLDKNQLPLAQLEESFAMWWPKLEQEIDEIPPPSVKSGTERSEYEILEEILSIVRELRREAGAHDDLGIYRYHTPAPTPQQAELLKQRFLAGENPSKNLVWSEEERSLLKDLQETLKALGGSAATTRESDDDESA